MFSLPKCVWLKKFSAADTLFHRLPASYAFGTVSGLPASASGLECLVQVNLDDLFTRLLFERCARWKNLEAHVFDAWLRISWATSTDVQIIRFENASSPRKGAVSTTFWLLNKFVSRSAAMTTSVAYQPQTENSTLSDQGVSTCSHLCTCSASRLWVARMSGNLAVGGLVKIKKVAVDYQEGAGFCSVDKFGIVKSLKFWF